MSCLISDVHKAPSDLVDLLVQTNLYDMAFSVLLRFFKGSGLKRCCNCSRIAVYHNGHDVLFLSHACKCDLGIFLAQGTGNSILRYVTEMLSK